MLMGEEIKEQLQALRTAATELIALFCVGHGMHHLAELRRDDHGPLLLCTFRGFSYQVSQTQDKSQPVNIAQSYAVVG